MQLAVAGACGFLRRRRTGVLLRCGTIIAGDRVSNPIGSIPALKTKQIGDCDDQRGAGTRLEPG